MSVEILTILLVISVCFNLVLIVLLMLALSYANKVEAGKHVRSGKKSKRLSVDKMEDDNIKPVSATKTASATKPASATKTASMAKTASIKKTASETKTIDDIRATADIIRPAESIQNNISKKGNKPGTDNDKDYYKYSEYVKNYLMTKYNATVIPQNYRRYHSDIHGMECAEFVYKLGKGLNPKVFKANMNSIDTAITNMAGTNAITFEVVGAEAGTYKTIFYLK
ncbi:MAG: hypothetical protein K6G03_01410 [Lachnospiraceae bacterium]|nr:hypothetical protein [Lachnospiraceae bacterium]